jgi:deazaflavin-dependent oxidoreductase (nitroreductase family)
MTAESSNPPGDNASAPAGRPQTLAFQGLANRVVRGLLRAPLLSGVVGEYLLTLYVVGRKSGRRFAVPVAYVEHDGLLLIGSPFGWGRNLRTGEPVQIRWKGRRRPAEVEVVTDEAGVARDYALIARGNRNFAKFNEIRFDPEGNPDPADLRRAWVAGARVFRLAPR